MAPSPRSQPGELLTEAMAVISTARRVVLVSPSNQARKATKGIAEIVRGARILTRARWLRLRNGRLLPILPRGIDSYPDGRRIMHFTVLAREADR